MATTAMTTIMMIRMISGGTVMPKYLRATAVMAITAPTAISIGTLTGYTAYTLTTDAFDSGSALTADLWYSYTPVAVSRS